MLPKPYDQPLALQRKERERKKGRERGWREEFRDGRRKRGEAGTKKKEEERKGKHIRIDKSP